MDSNRMARRCAGICLLLLLALDAPDSPSFVTQAALWLAALVGAQLSQNDGSRSGFF